MINPLLPVVSTLFIASAALPALSSIAFPIITTIAVARGAYLLMPARVKEIMFNHINAGLNLVVMKAYSLAFDNPFNNGIYANDFMEGMLVVGGAIQTGCQFILQDFTSTSIYKPSKLDIGLALYYDIPHKLGRVFEPFFGYEYAQAVGDGFETCLLYSTCRHFLPNEMLPPGVSIAKGILHNKTTVKMQEAASYAYLYSITSSEEAAKIGASAISKIQSSEPEEVLEAIVLEKFNTKYVEGPLKPCFHGFWEGSHNYFGQPTRETMVRAFKKFHNISIPSLYLSKPSMQYLSLPWYEDEREEFNHLNPLATIDVCEVKTTHTQFSESQSDNNSLVSFETSNLFITITKPCFTGEAPSNNSAQIYTF